MAIVFQINRSNGGVPKTGVHAAEIRVGGMAEDDQNDREHHGGPDQDLCIYRLEAIQALQEEGHPIFPGSTGENITTFGLSSESLQPGTHIRLGEVEAILTDYATPCTTIAASFHDRNSNRINQKKHPGWSRMYARVTRGGRLTVGDQIQILRHEPGTEPTDGHKN